MRTDPAKYRGHTMVFKHGYIWASRDSDHKMHMLCRDFIEMRKVTKMFREYVDGVLA